ncbi:MAG: hypothetical protein ACK506_16285 [Pirellula sp.]
MQSGIREAPALAFEGDHGSRMSVRYTNLGEPFREFVEIVHDNSAINVELWVKLNRREVLQLRDKLNEFLGE